MTATKVGIVYSVAQRKRRWMIVPDSDNELPLPVRPGEAYVEQPITDYLQRGPDAAVADAAGGPALSDRCAIIDKSNLVVDHIRGDPAIDVVQAHSLVVSDISTIGDAFQNGVFLRRFVLVDATGLVTGAVVADATKPPAPLTGGKTVSSATLQIGAQIILETAASPALSQAQPA